MVMMSLSFSLFSFFFFFTFLVLHSMFDELHSITMRGRVIPSWRVQESGGHVLGRGVALFFFSLFSFRHWQRRGTYDDCMTDEWLCSYERGMGMTFVLFCVSSHFQTFS